MNQIPQTVLVLISTIRTYLIKQLNTSVGKAILLMQLGMLYRAAYETYRLLEAETQAL